MSYNPIKYKTPTGTTLNCKGWVQEAALRMLLNNLDPEVAERPEELIVYGGRGKAARNFGPIMAMAGKRSVASVHDIVELGAIDPEHIVTPGIFVSALVQVPRLATQGGGFKLAP